MTFDISFISLVFFAGFDHSAVGVVVCRFDLVMDSITCALFPDQQRASVHSAPGFIASTLLSQRFLG